MVETDESRRLEEEDRTKALKNFARHEHQECNPETGERAFLHRVEAYFHQRRGQHFCSDGERAANGCILRCGHPKSVLQQLDNSAAWWCSYCGAIVPDAEVRR